jgi:hypothetical protein
MGFGGTTSTPINRISCDIGAVNINGTLNLDCANAKITTAGNMNIGIVNINASGECLKMTGTNNTISSYDLSGNRNYYMGTVGSSKNLNIINEKNGAIVMYSGNDGTTSNPGRNKIWTYSQGVQFYRGGTPEIYGGEIGLSNFNNNVFHILSNGGNDIYIFSGNGATTIETTNLVSLVCNNVRIGSGTINSSTGFYSNLYFLDSGGNNWIAQSSAFTEAIKSDVANSKAKFTSASSFGSNKGKISLIKSFEIIGQAAGTTQLLNSTAYIGGTNYNVGLAFRQTGLYNSLFDSTGKYVALDGKGNFSLSCEIGFLCKNSSFKSLRSYIQLQTDEFVNIENSLTQGVFYRTAQTFNETIYYNVNLNKFFMDYGVSGSPAYIFLATNFDFTTGTEGTLTRMECKFTLERNVL